MRSRPNAMTDRPSCDERCSNPRCNKLLKPGEAQTLKIDPSRKPFCPQCMSQIGQTMHRSTRRQVRRLQRGST